MYEILSLKYDQVPNFRKGIQRLARKKRIPSEATTSVFWGSGIDITHVSRLDYEELRKSKIKGANYLGWTICMVYVKKTEDFYWLPLLETLLETFVQGYKKVSELLAEEGLEVKSKELHEENVNECSSGSDSSSGANGTGRDGGESPHIPGPHLPDQSEQEGHNHSTVYSE